MSAPSDWVFDIPVPPSVNRTRKVYWQGHRKLEKWRSDVGWHLVGNGQHRKAPFRLGRYELIVTLDRSKCRLDPDNVLKAGIDLLRHLNFIADDGPKHCERIVVEWGQAPDGCRLTLRGVA